MVSEELMTGGGVRPASYPAEPSPVPQNRIMPHLAIGRMSTRPSVINSSETMNEALSTDRLARY